MGFFGKRHTLPEEPSYKDQWHPNVIERFIKHFSYDVVHKGYTGRLDMKLHSFNLNVFPHELEREAYGYVDMGYRLGQVDVRLKFYTHPKDDFPGITVPRWCAGAPEPEEEKFFLKHTGRSIYDQPDFQNRERLGWFIFNGMDLQTEKMENVFLPFFEVTFHLLEEEWQRLSEGFSLAAAGRKDWTGFFIRLKTDEMPTDAIFQREGIPTKPQLSKSFDIVDYGMYISVGYSELRTRLEQIFC